MKPTLYVRQRASVSALTRPELEQYVASAREFGWVPSGSVECVNDLSTQANAVFQRLVRFRIRGVAWQRMSAEHKREAIHLAEQCGQDPYTPRIGVTLWPKEEVA